MANSYINHVKIFSYQGNTNKNNIEIPSHLLKWLVGIQISVATVEISMEGPQKTKIKTII
jgi:hypothetical protein